jgi:signal transduction histidine kinase
MEREAVTKRFYRSDKSRGTEGLGLGLSLVAAIVRLHGFEFAITAGPGCTVEIVCPEARYSRKRTYHQHKPKITDAALFAAVETRVLRLSPPS